MSKGEFLTPDDLATRWGGVIHKGTLANWRSKGTGPQYIKLNGRVLYRVSDIEAWERDHLITPRGKQDGH